MERTQLDNQRWNSMIGKTFYALCPDNEKYYRSIYVRHNPFSNHLQPMISNPVYGVPPEGLEPISPLMLNRLMRLQMSSSFF
jgi:hypothetical protein